MSHIPKGFHSVTPYLHINGADAFIEFAKRAFGAEVLGIHHDENGQVVHGEIVIEGSVLEVSDGRPEWPPRPFALHVFVPDADVAFARAVAAGATASYEVTTHEYGERSGAVKDEWGNDWYLATVVDPAKRMM